MMDWKVGDRVLWVVQNEVVGEEGKVQVVEDNLLLVWWNDDPFLCHYSPEERCLVRWPK